MPVRRCKFYNQCKHNAVTFISHSRMPLCKEHYIKNIEFRVKKTIDEFKLISPQDKVLVALSGGKDSCSLLTILANVLQKNVPLEALYIDLQISPENYSKDSGTVAQELCKKLDVPLHIVNFKQEYGFGIDDIHEVGQFFFKHRDDSKVGHFRGECSYCGLMKRYIINKFAVDNKFTKLATGHNLTDEATTLMSNFFSVDVDLMGRAGPTTSTDVEMLIPRVKPLYYIYETETILYAFYADVPHLATECAYATDSPMIKVKKSLEQIETYRRGNMLHMMKKYQDTLKPILFAAMDPEKKVEKKCNQCGMATYLDTCSFCKTKERITAQINEMNRLKEQEKLN